jgi:hypothetical protein
VGLSDLEKERFKEVNRAMAEKGLPVVWPTDWEAAVQQGDELNEVVVQEFSPLDNNPIAQRLASWWVAKHVSNGDDQRQLDTRFCPEYDDADPATMTRLYVLAYPRMEVFPLSDPGQYKRVAEELLPLNNPDAMCFANITRDCDGLNPCEHLVVKRGEYLCVLTICAPCRQAVDTLDFDSDEYVGPRKSWFDDREGVPPDDPSLPKSPWAPDDPWSI